MKINNRYPIEVQVIIGIIILIILVCGVNNWFVKFQTFKETTFTYDCAKEKQRKINGIVLRKFKGPKESFNIQVASGIDTFRLFNPPLKMGSLYYSLDEGDSIAKPADEFKYYIRKSNSTTIILQAGTNNCDSLYK